MPQETAALLDFDPAYDRHGVTKRRTLSSAYLVRCCRRKRPSALCDRASILQSAIGRQAVAAVPIACRLDLDDKVPDHSTFSVNRHGRFRDSDILRHVFEVVVRACMDADLVKGGRLRRRRMASRQQK
jgi:transposase-like protein DUF772